MLYDIGHIKFGAINACRPEENDREAVPRYPQTVFLRCPHENPVAHQPASLSRSVFPRRKPFAFQASINDILCTLWLISEAKKMLDGRESNPPRRRNVSFYLTPYLLYSTLNERSFIRIDGLLPGLRAASFWPLACSLRRRSPGRSRFLRFTRRTLIRPCAHSFLFRHKVSFFLNESHLLGIAPCRGALSVPQAIV